MSIVELDSKGRITLPRKIRETVGIKARVLAISAGDHLKIIPLPSDPVKSLDGVLDIEKPFRELRNEAEKLAAKEARKGPS
ncbi:MAG: AbrB/MazE/SpoVT family DNA-binding domain-containing protein [Nitrososphaerota archaeon]|nr:AbrB/MazE/SpoVT family DNA-binding domain-containing protein [Nitrososphaerota archaeon]MDG7020276.1 AbrB/MazE/SpoVT family DNA-binding domain-containing protein [Nitrososphaerota archaeon]MDG7028176.1 AbrB/MazE/SpoVT family DNA-binding domain-containing protein [Nitrososphaerota archaeon]